MAPNQFYVSHSSTTPMSGSPSLPLILDLMQYNQPKNYTRTYHMITRSQTSSLKPKTLFLTNSFPPEMTTFPQAIEHAEWRKAMDGDFTAML